MADKLFKDYFNERTAAVGFPVDGKLLVQTGTSEPNKLDVSEFTDLIGVKTPEQFGIKSDGTDEAVKLQQLFDLGGIIRLDNEYTTSAKLVMQPNSTIIGKGTIKQADGSTPTALLETADYCVVEGITLNGLMTKTLADYSTGSGYGAENYNEAIALLDLGTTSGIINSGYRCSVHGVKFYNLDKWCIEFTENAVNESQQPLYADISNCLGFKNAGGFYIPERSEYQNFTSNVIKYNLYGTYCVGGNNTFTGNKIDHNRVNFILADGINDSHGEFVGGSLNHGKLASILCEKISNGFLFNGVSVFDGGSLGITINESRGFRITGSTLSRINLVNNGVFDEVGSTGVNTVSNCYFGLLGTTYTITENDTNGASNLELFNNSMLEGGDDTAWKNYLLNNRKYDKDGWIYQLINGKNTIVGNDVAQYHVGGSNVTGALAIKMPFGFSNQEVKLDISISDISGEMTDLTVMGYLAGGGTWTNVRASYKSQDATFELSFGKDTTDNTAILYIGATSEVWRHHFINISKLEASGGSLNNVKFYKLGWAVSVENTLQNVTATLAKTGGYVDFNGDCDDLDYNYEGYVNGTALNTPVTASGTIKCIFRDVGSSYGTQTYITVSGDYYYRTRNITYGAWVKLN